MIQMGNSWRVIYEKKYFVQWTPIIKNSEKTKGFCLMNMGQKNKELKVSSIVLVFLILHMLCAQSHISYRFKIFI